jgi:hypothetical protein
MDSAVETDRSAAIFVALILELTLFTAAPTVPANHHGIGLYIPTQLLEGFKKPRGAADRAPIFGNRGVYNIRTQK